MWSVIEKDDLMMNGLTSHDFRSAIHTLGISGRVVCLHTSLRSFGRIQAPSPDMAAKMVINAFLDEGCTLLVPTFSRIFEVAPPPSAMFVPHNALDTRNINQLWYDYLVAIRSDYQTPHFTPQTTLLDVRDMGILPTVLLQMDGHIRGNHPLMSFTAIGDHAETLVKSQQPDDGYAPMRELIGLNGVVGLLGVGYERMSLLHYAEKLAGRRLFIRWAMNADGEIIPAEVGGCSNGFEKFAPYLNPLAKVAIVGKSLWRFYEAEDVATRASARIKQTPTITQCDNPACAFCRDVLSQK
ncbi:MAG: hypothetical protein CUN52_10780 [Phototrophicales bacterium]|nr:MAG: hypothetical protein CUN52_10780 [Phototrophicales bacterium]